ncbi:hypothetical protein GCM10010377_42070 [Streptomyces viridiviolaceus]|uniref:Uncharacterized protein n=1 Tax=Streptomyces viridiviolaceus TaxID=68282 RepID=A0ABW2E956_9ACTN|nr:hypothetical protein [Streptomyces viridiviolaceus]GHB46749.1 hypothetical protein GCM10010377_42070 [Streptomyces viridiviolaceus]
MGKIALRSVGAAAATLCFLTGSAWGATASEFTTRPQRSQVVALPQVLTCYATVSEPDRVVCYRVSYRHLHQNGQIEFVPFLIQVPTPANPPPVTVVGSLPET